MTVRRFNNDSSDDTISVYSCHTCGTSVEKKNCSCSTLDKQSQHIISMEREMDRSASAVMQAMCRSMALERELIRMVNLRSDPHLYMVMSSGE